jgi:phage shock protein PspC (stress-responsive transcriptional regulator)
LRGLWGVFQGINLYLDVSYTAIIVLRISLRFMTETVIESLLSLQTVNT